MGSPLSSCMKMDPAIQAQGFQLPQSVPQKAKSVSNVTRAEAKKNIEQASTNINSTSSAGRTSTATTSKAESKQQQTTGPKVGIEDFLVFAKLGIGTFGIVYAGYLKKQQGKKNKKAYAIKTLKKAQINENELQQNLKLQKQIMTEPNCSFLTKLAFTFRTEDLYFLVMEFAEKGDVFGLLHPGGMRQQKIVLEDDTIRFIVGCVVLGLEYLHSQNIIYQDMKPENLLIFEDGYVKITDFGLSQNCASGLQKAMLVGTPEYFAPEMIMCQRYGKGIDLWALGVLTFELANNKVPYPYDEFDSQEDYIDLINSGDRGRRWRHKKVNSDLKDFVGRLLMFNPAHRLGAKNWKQVKQHSFFRSVNFDWQALKQRKMLSPLRKSGKSNIQNIRKTFLQDILKQDYQTNKDIQVTSLIVGA